MRWRGARRGSIRGAPRPSSRSATPTWCSGEWRTAEDAFRKAIALNPNQADGLHGLSQLLAALGRVDESLTMREHLQAGEQFIINYTADTAEIYWLAGDTAKAVAMLQPFRPGRTLELALVLASAGRYQEAAAALREMPASNYPAGMLEAAAKILDAAPAKAADPAALPRVGNLSFAYMHVGAPERVLEFYEDEIARRLLPADLVDLVLASDLCRGAQDRAVQEGRARARPRRLLARARLAGAVPRRRAATISSASERARPSRYGASWPGSVPGHPAYEGTAVPRLSGSPGQARRRRRGAEQGTDFERIRQSVRRYFAPRAT